MPVSGAAAATLSGTVSGQPASGEPEGLAEVNITVFDSEGGELVASAGSQLGGKYTLETPDGVFDVKFDPGPFSPYQATTIPKFEVAGSAELNVTLKEGKASGEDIEAPRIDELSIEPTSIDTGESARTVTLRAHITDDLSGFSSGRVFFRSPSGNQQVYSSAFSRTAGSDTDGEYEIPLSFKQFSEGGTWTISVIRLTDKTGNERGLEPGQIDELGLPSKVFVKGVEDTEAPKIDELGIEPEFIDTTSSARTVTLFAHITDDLSGFKEGRFIFDSPSGSQEAIGTIGKPSAGTGLNGDYEAPLTFKQFSESGVWTISVIRLTDHAGNERELAPGQIEELGLSHTVIVGGEADIEAPKIDELGIEPTSIDTSSSAQVVQLHAHLTDDLSGVSQLRIFFRSPSGKQSVLNSGLNLLSGNALDGDYEAPLTFKQFSESGVWTISVIRLTDHAGNERELAPEAIEELGLPHAVFVKSEEPDDHTPPRVDELSIEPTSIDTGESARTVTLRAHITDDLSGFKEGRFTFRSPGGQQQAVGVVSEPVPGTVNGDYEIPLTFKHLSEGGIWKLTIRLADQHGVERELTPGQLEELGLPHTVLLEGEGDGEAPRLQSLEIEPSEIDTTTEARSVLVTAAITDDLSGFERGAIKLFAPGGEQGVSSLEFKRIAGSANEGLYRAELVIPPGSEGGPWNISVIELSDQVGNRLELDPEQIEAAGFPHTVLVKGEEEVKDTEAPKINELSIEPTEVNTGGASRTVTLRAHITDDLAGFKGGKVLFESPSGKHSTAGFEFGLTAGDANNGSYKIPVTFGAYSENGAWQIATIRLADAAGHERVLDAKQIEELGLPHTVLVAGTEDTEAPQIHGLSLEPPEIYTYSSGKTVTLHAHIIEDLSGFVGGTIVFTSPSGEQSTSGSDFSLINGDVLNGGYEIHVPFKQGSESGIWLISAIHLVDAAGNERVVGPEEMAGIGLPRKVRVESKEDFIDVQPPNLGGLQIIPSSIDTSSSGQTVTLFAYVSDSYAGFKSGSFTFASPSGNETTSASEFKRVAGNANGGTYELSVPFEQLSESGTWLVSVRLTDAAGNERVLGAADLEAVELPHAVLVKGEEKDFEAPVLDELALEPEFIDSTAGDWTVSVLAHISDDYSGLKEVRVNFVSPSGKHSTEGSTTEPVEGSSTNGTFKIPVKFPQFSEGGTWTISSIFLGDHAGHEQKLSAGQIEEMGLQRKVFVKGEEEPEEPKDSESPQLHGVSVEPTEIDTSTTKQPVFVTAKISDNESGFKSGEVVFVSPNGKQLLDGGEFKLVSGNEIEGVYRFTVTFPQGSEAGAWGITKVRLRDKAGNEVGIPGAEIEGSKTVFVNNEEPKDSEAPQLHGLSIEPTEIDTSSEKQPVVVTAKISDNDSGFKEGFLAFVSPSGEQSVTGGEFKLLSGNEKEGLYQVVVTFPQGSEGGEWNVSAVTLIDQAGNKVGIPRKEIEEAGMPHTVIVSAAAPVITAVEPSSGPEAGGTEVLISGSGFSGTKEVRFGSKPASEFAVKSANLVWAMSPPGTGTVDVTVTTAAGSSEASAADRFAYAPQVTLSSTPNPSVHGQKVTFTAKVIPAGGPTPIGTVAFTEGTSVLGVVNLNKGTATFNTTALSAGKHPIYASYSGDANYPASQSPTLTQNVEKASTQLLLSSSLNPAPYGSNATLKATVNALAPGAGTPAGTVTFRDGETVIDTVQLNGHSASLSLKTMPPGEHAISASYSGDPNNQPSSAEPLVETIVKASTELELTSSLNPAPYGSSATLKATVDSVAPSVLTPTGTVTFREGETVLAIVPLNAGGVAKYPLKTVAPGSYEITATYNGDEGFKGSEATLKQTLVKASTELALTSSKNPAPKGSTGTLKATLKTLAPGGGTPAGTVTFREGETVLATIPLSGSSVTYPLKSLAVGTHNITATYGGSANYLESEGAISQVITP